MHFVKSGIKETGGCENKNNFIHAILYYKIQETWIIHESDLKSNFKR